jgi:hypothetical protein
MHRLSSSALALVVCLLAPSIAAAQPCTEGRVPTPEGYCCWPGQQFIREQGGCVGAPLHYAPTAPTYAVQAPGVHTQTVPTQTVDTELDTAPDDTGFFLRATLGGGYGHYLYTDSARNGGGPIVATSITLGARLGGGLWIGGTGAFEPEVVASGSGGTGESWGPLFTPAGYFGFTIGLLVDELLELDVTIAFGGGGNGTGAGGFGPILAPSLGVIVASVGGAHFGAYVRPAAGLLVDPNGGRLLFHLTVNGGLAISFY